MTKMTGKLSGRLSSPISKKASGRTSPAALLTALLLITAPAFGVTIPQIEKASSARDGEVFTTDLQMKGEIDTAEAQVQFINESVQVDIPDLSLSRAKFLSRTNDRLVKSVYVTQPDPSTTRIRYILKTGFLAKSLEDQVRIQKSAGHIYFQITGDAKRGVAPKSEIESTKILAIADADSIPEEPGTVMAKLVVDGGAAAGSTASASNVNPNGAGGDAKMNLKADVKDSAPAADAQKKEATRDALNKLPESQIPVLAELKTEKKDLGSPWPRLMLTLGVLVALLAATTFGLKKWAARAQGANQNTKIRVLTTHHLGPKKSVAILQVAGESILIGITDQNISMLKTLSLIDDEVPEQVPNHFDRSLAEEFEDDLDDETDERGGHFAMRGIAEIRDVVAGRLAKQMPNQTSKESLHRSGRNR